MGAEIDNVVWEYPETNLNNELTLAGAIRRYWTVISEKWIADRTINENVQDYRRRILRQTDPFKALSDYTDADFSRIIDALSSENDYKEGTKQHYEHLIQLIVDACIEGGENVHPSLNKTSGALPTSSVKQKLIKSFTPEENERLYQWLKNLDAKTVTGPEIGVAFMFVLGLRNQEAAGLTFSSVFYDDDIGVEMCRITQTVIGKTRETKIKGKTPNAHRELPIYCTVLGNLIYNRQLQIQMITGVRNISMLPICCGKDVQKHCTYDEITQCAYRLFKELNITGSTWESLGIEAEDFEEIRQKEKDPTAYALRRNAATRYYGLDLTEAELHYIMGHAIDVTGIQRSDYTNSDTMGLLLNKLKKHRYYLEGNNA